MMLLLGRPRLGAQNDDIYHMKWAGSAAMSHSAATPRGRRGSNTRKEVAWAHLDLKFIKETNYVLI